ncbi:hypothetical protein PUN28_017615 [Cardiocondyla obscurior]|uniref:Snurportin-1 n=1 Tax=Cardiocondyla obscurior TaxID=286306 RepID=A0AAW2EIC8_9HYME
MAESLNNISNNISNNENDNISEGITDKKGGTVNDCDARETVRRQFYKNRIKRDNVKLEIEDNTPQEERRRLLLEYQKKHRDETINAARGILPEVYSSKSQEEERMDVEEQPSWYHKVVRKVCKNNRMMLSEWMLDVPQDLIENWIMVPCPTGNRVRLISGRGETKAYSRKGNIHGVFPSALPGGNPNSDTHASAAIDCIWIKSRKLFYILDVLYWNQLPFTNCEAEFRLFWINNKFKETPEFRERNTDTNRYPILPSQNIDCNCDFNLALANINDELHPLDGFLFYHRKALYTFGQTPLVTWLKPFMLPEVLGVFVPSPLDKKPNDYINFEHHVEKIKTKKKCDKIKSASNLMEVESLN